MSVFQVTDHIPSQDLGNKGILSTPSFASSLINLYPDSNGIASLLFGLFLLLLLFFRKSIPGCSTNPLLFQRIQLCQESSLSHRRNGIKPPKPLEFPYGCWDKAPWVSWRVWNAERERGYFQAGKAGSAPSFPIPRDVLVLEQASISQIPVFYLLLPWKPKAADQWEIFSRGVNSGWMGLGNGGSCPCPWQGVGMGSSLKSLPTQTILGIFIGKSSKLGKKRETKILSLERRQRKG